MNGLGMGLAADEIENLIAGQCFKVRATPKASQNTVKMDMQPDGAPLVRVYVTAVADKGKANAAIIKLLAKELGLPKSSLAIVKGSTDRNKTIAICS